MRGLGGSANLAKAAGQATLAGLRGSNVAGVPDLAGALPPGWHHAGAWLTWLAVAGLRGLAALTNLANLAGLPRFLPGLSGLQKGQASG